MAWTSILLLAGPAILLVYALRRRDGRRTASPRTLLAIYAIAAAAPLVFAILWRLDATRIAIELHGIAFRSDGSEVIRKDVRERRPGSGRIVIGDHTSQRPRARFGTLVFTPGAANATGALQIALPPRPERAGLIATEEQGILGAIPIEDDDRICIAGSCWTYDGGAFTNGDLVAEIPSRRAEIPGPDWSFPLPFARPATAPLRTWSLDFLARESGAIPPERRVRSFVAHANPGARLRLIALDRDVYLERGGTRIDAPSTFDIADGDRITFYTLPHGSGEFAAPGIVDRRSVVYRAGSDSFVLDLDTPEVHTLTVEEIRALQLAQQQGVTNTRVALSMGDAQLVDRSLYFTSLSESVAVEASALFELARTFPRNLSSAFRIISPRGPVEARLGSVQWLGASDLAAIRLDVLRPPLLLLILGALLLPFKAIAAHAARFTTAQLLIAGGIELLAGIRLLLGYRVWSMPPHRVEAAELATVAWMALPWIFIVACLPIGALRDWREWRASAAPALAGLLFSAVFCALVVEGPAKWVWVACHLLAIAAAAARSDEAANAAARSREWLRDRMRRATGYLGVPRYLGTSEHLRESDPSEVPRSRGTEVLRGATNLLRDPIIVAALAFTVVRFVMLLFGWKESANLGVRVSLSVLHIPAAVILQGIYFWRVWQTRHVDLKPALAILFFVWLIPAAITSDVGLALLNIPLLVLLLLAVTRHGDTHEHRWVARALVAIVVLFLAVGPIVRVFLPLVKSDEFLLSVASDSNYARFLHFAAPERLQALATKRGESLAITSAVLQRYIDSGLFGRGYGHSEVSPHLGDTALRDFAPAVFIAAEWGLIGTLAALLIYLLFPIAARDWLPWNGSDEHPGPAIAFVAAATIAVASIYMILVNHELVLLTGKNAYLLGLDSAGDVIEVIALLLLVAYGSTVARDDDMRPYGGIA